MAAGTVGGTPTSYTVTAYAANGTAAGTCTVAGASGFCDVTGLTGGSTYTVTATAKNSAGDSGESGASSTVTVTAPTRPGMPPQPTVVAGTTKVTATVAAGKGGTPTSYTVKAYDDAANRTCGFSCPASYESCTVTGASGSCDVTGLTAGGSYTVTATASNSAGTSDESDSTFAVTITNSTVPGTPPKPTVVAGTAMVTATVAAGTVGGTPTSYTVTAYAANGTAAGTCTVAGASGFCGVTGLTGGSTYTVKAAAKNAGGTSGESVASSPVTLAATVPGAPACTPTSTRICAVAGANANEVHVSWIEAYGTGYVYDTGYFVQFQEVLKSGLDTPTKEPAGSCARLETVDSTVRQCTATSVPAGTNQFRTANMKYSPTVYSNWTVVDVIGAPRAPVIGAATVTGATKATVTFTAPTDTGGADITGYTVASVSGNITKTATTAGTVTVGGLTVGTSYTFTVTATNAAGFTSVKSAPSGTVAVPWCTASASQTCAVAGTNAGEVVVSWGTMTPPNNVKYVGYEVQIKSGTGDWAGAGTGCSSGNMKSAKNATGCTVTGLAAGTYSFKVAPLAKVLGVNVPASSVTRSPDVIVAG